MTDIRFYHLTRQSLDQALPAILTKAFSGGRRVVVKCADEQMVRHMNDHLWTYRPDSFLPHGAKKDGHAENQPIWLTTTEENPNSADVLILTGGAVSDQIGNYAMCCEMLEGHDGSAVQDARARWKTYRDGGHDITYWQQTDAGGWEKKA